MCHGCQGNVTGVQLHIDERVHTGQDKHHHQRGNNGVHFQQITHSTIDKGEYHGQHNADHNGKQQRSGRIAQQHHQGGIQAHLPADTDIHISQCIDKHGAHRHQGGDNDIGHKGCQLALRPDAFAEYGSQHCKQNDAEHQTTVCGNRCGMVFEPLLVKLLLFLHFCRLLYTM